MSWKKKKVPAEALSICQVAMATAASVLTGDWPKSRRRVYLQEIVKHIKRTTLRTWKSIKSHRTAMLARLAALGIDPATCRSCLPPDDP